MAVPLTNFQSPCLENIMRILNFQRWKLPPSNFFILSRTPFEKKTFWTQMIQETLFQNIESFGRNLRHLWNLMFSTTQRPLFHTLQIFNESKNSPPHTFSNFKVEILNNLKNFLPNTFTLKFYTFKNLKNKFFTLEKLTTLWRNLFHTSHSLGKTPTLFTIVQTNSLPSKGFSLSMLYKLNPCVLIVLA